VDQITGRTGWSDRLAPTPGLSASTSMPISIRWSAGPMPDSISSCGLLTAPPDKMTSAPACSLATSPCRRYVTPVAWPPSTMTLVTRASVSTVRFGRDMAGCR
jgi:hypothetical protein